jgi:predicted phosphate transport protein (TIGR00153 family)
LSLFESKDSFYDLLEAQAQAAHDAAKEFYVLAQDFAQTTEHSQAIKQIEHDADDLTHSLANKIDSTFVTPLDKEDLRALSGALDDITDLVEAAASRIALYQLPAPRPDLAPMVSLLVDITQAIKKTVAVLRHIKNHNDVRDIFINVHRIENESDAAFRRALGDLFNAPNADPIMVMKWKEVYDRIEIAVDKCEDVANIVESVVVKYA